jgi:PAS domain S-box-containing protein
VDAVAPLDVIAAAGFVVAFVLTWRLPEDRIDRASRTLLLAVLGVSALVDLSNVLQHAGITAYFDTYEDYAEILFVPFFLFFAYTVRVKGELGRRIVVEARLKESEARYRRLVDLSPDAILVFSDDEAVFANRAAARLLHAGAAEDVLGLPMDSVVGAAGDPPDEAAHAPEAAPRRMVRFDGTTVEVEAATAPFVYEGREAVLAVVRDITERRQLEVLKEDFVSTVSHELRTPLTAILGYVGLLRERQTGQKDDLSWRAIERIGVRARDMAAMVDGLLHVSKMDQQRPLVGAQDVDPARVIESAVERACIRPPHRLVVDVQPGLAHVAGDTERLTYALSNLLSNAVKFSPGGGKIRLEGRSEDGTLAISVIDEGVGIPAEQLESIFERFSQGDMSPRRRFGGFGLGLYLARRIAEAHGGHVIAQSVPGQGSTFTLKLPVSPRER